MFSTVWVQGLVINENFPPDLPHIHVHTYICTCVVAKAGASLVPIAMSHSCVNMRLSKWKMLLFSMYCHLFQDAPSFLQALRSNIQSEILPLSWIQMHINCLNSFISVTVYMPCRNDINFSLNYSCYMYFLPTFTPCSILL